MARRPRSIIYGAAVLAGLLAPPEPGRGEDELLWPLQSQPRSITGTFMEPRSRHYHSGLDIRTEGRTGLPVRAPAAGWIGRIRVSPEGYGKALYLRLADGRTLVFAHLSHFADAFQAPVTRAQARAGVYEQDLRFEANQLPVEAGQLIALSGATGIGAPHLHLEVRDAAERPQNPLTHGFAVPDREPPRITGLRLVPLDAEARVEGLAQAHRFEAGATVAAAGRLGLQIELVDTTGISPHTLMPLGLEVRLDGEVVYRIEQQSFDFSQGRQMRLEIVPDPERKSRWVRAYRHRGNDLPARSGAQDGATFALAADESVRQVEVRAWDAAGNEGRAAFLVRAERPPVLRQATLRGAPTPAAVGWSVQLDPGEAVLQVRVAGPFEDPLDLGAVGVELDVPGRSRPLRPAWSTQGRELCAAVEYGLLAPGRIEVRVVDRDLDRTLADAFVDLAPGGQVLEWVPLADGRIALDDPQAKGLFEGGGVWAEAGASLGKLPEGTRKVMGGWSIHSTAAFRDGVAVAVRLESDADPGGLGLFLREPDGDWSLLGGDLVETTDEDGAPAVYLRGELDGTGVVAVLRDLDPPYLGAFTAEGRPLPGVLPVLHPRAQREFRGITLPRWPSLELPLVDAGAGLSASGIVAQLDGKPFPARWDPEAERLYFDFDPDPGEGVHRAQVAVTDDLGNTRESRLEFELRDF